LSISEGKFNTAEKKLQAKVFIADNYLKISVDAKTSTEI